MHHIWRVVAKVSRVHKFQVYETLEIKISQVCHATSKQRNRSENAQWILVDPAKAFFFNPNQQTSPKPQANQPAAKQNSLSSCRFLLRSQEVQSDGAHPIWLFAGQTNSLAQAWKASCHCEGSSSRWEGTCGVEKCTSLDHGNKKSWVQYGSI